MILLILTIANSNNSSNTNDNDRRRRGGHRDPGQPRASEKRESNDFATYTCIYIYIYI